MRCEQLAQGLHVVPQKFVIESEPVWGMQLTGIIIAGLLQSLMVTYRPWMHEGLRADSSLDLGRSLWTTWCRL